MKGFQWNDHWVERLRALAAEGHTTRVVADLLSKEVGYHTFSKGSIIGKSNRMGIEVGIPSVPRKTPEEKRIIEEQKKAMLKQYRPVTETRPTSCQYPMGDPRKPGFHFCGAPLGATEGQRASWCNEHAKIVFRKPRDWERSIFKFAQRAA